MAKAITIQSWCDICLEDAKETPGETYEFPAMLGEPAFELELCGEDLAPFAQIHKELSRLGRTPEKYANAGRTAGRTRPDQTASAVTCPECGNAYNSLAAIRGHLRRQHDKSLAAAGLAPANFVCPTCGDGFPNRQGLAAHARASHPDVKQSA